MFLKDEMKLRGKNKPSISIIFGLLLITTTTLSLKQQHWCHYAMHVDFLISS
jgi:hypothetical protein